MKTPMKTLLFTALLSVTAAPAVLADPAPPPHPIVGGYKTGDAASAEATAQAKYAVELLQHKTGDRKLALVAVKAYAKQVVAGTNTKLDLEVMTKDGAKSVSVVMYTDLEQHRSLTSVTGL
jgi:hypothetical protein